MIKGRCFTNLDNCSRFAWPEVFVAVPRKGERVVSVCGRCELKVHGITHTLRKVKLDTTSNYGAELEPFIKVELHN